MVLYSSLFGRAPSHGSPPEFVNRDCGTTTETTSAAPDDPNLLSQLTAEPIQLSPSEIRIAVLLCDIAGSWLTSDRILKLSVSHARHGAHSRCSSEMTRLLPLVKDWSTASWSALNSFS